MTVHLCLTLDAAVRAYSRLGLTNNIIKTEVVCQWSANIPPSPPVFTLTDKQLSVVPSFRYLGCIHSKHDSIDDKVPKRIHQTSAVFERIRHQVFLNQNLHLHTKSESTMLSALPISSAALKPEKLISSTCRPWNISTYIAFSASWGSRGMTMCLTPRCSEKQAAKALRPQLPSNDYDGWNMS